MSPEKSTEIDCSRIKHHIVIKLKLEQSRMYPSKHHPINHCQVDTIPKRTVSSGPAGKFDRVQKTRSAADQRQASRFRQRSCTPPIGTYMVTPKPSPPESIVILASLLSHTEGSVSCHSCQHHFDKERPTQNLYFPFGSSACPYTIHSRL
jgi:hypothetical protein